MTTDVDAARDFYQKVFGWDMEKYPCTGNAANGITP
jgi:predicted enzyme related to lactoylglutathione lyase